MSYEGYDEHLCKNGHYWSADTYKSWPRNCPHCKEPPVWSNSVDLTNGEYPDDPSTMPYPLEVDKEAVLSECEHCGAIKLISVETFKIPPEA